MTSADPADEAAALVDLFGSEYGWTRDESLDVPIDQIPQLVHAILSRKGCEVYRVNPSTDKQTERLSDRIQAIFNKPVDTTE